MRIERSLVCLLFFAILLVLATGPPEVAAQEKQQMEVVQRVYKLQYANAALLHRVLQVFPVEITADPEQGIIAVSGTPESVAAFEAALKKLDVPPEPTKNIELTVYLLNATDEAIPGSEVPLELQDVVDQLTGVFPYKGFRLWETLVLRARDSTGAVDRGPKWISGTVPDNPELSYELGVRAATAVPDDDGRNVIRLDTLSLEINGPLAEFKTKDGPRTRRIDVASIRTDIDVREGQKVVVGKANIGPEKGALILVVTAKVL
jgi:hypothetical protein